MGARLVPLLVLGLLAMAACRPLTLTSPFGPASVASTATPTPVQNVPQVAAIPPGPVVALAALPGDEFLAAVGPIGDPETGLTWQVYRGRGDGWQRLAWPDEASPRSLHVSPSGDAIFAVPFSQAIFGAGQPWGLMRSTDGGQSWQQILNGLDDPYVMDVVLSPAFDEDHTLVAVTWRNGVYLSTDRGDTWRSLPYRRRIEPSGGANPYDLAVALSPDFRGGVAAARPIEQGLIVASFGHGLRLWSPKRGDWRTVALTVRTRIEDYDPPSAFLTAGAVAFSPSFTGDGTIYLYSGYAGLFRSADRGETWRVAGRRLPVASLPTGSFHLEVTSATEAYLLPAARKDDERTTQTPAAESGFVLYRTRDGGASWQALRPPPVPGEVSAFTLTRDEQGRVVLCLGGSHGGVSGYPADGLTWD